MEIYSPKAQKPDNFKKNTMRKKEGFMITSKATLTGRTVVFEMDKDNSIKNIHRQNLVTSMFDFLKLKFYNRMKVFFDYEDKFKGKTTDVVK